MATRKPIPVGTRFRFLVTIADPIRSRVMCRCDCGNTKAVRIDALKSGDTTSCGCAKKINVISIGTRFGRWVTIAERFSKKRGDGRGTRSFVVCQCDCGEVQEVNTDTLLCGASKSCGCAKEGGKEIEIGTRFGRLVVIRNVGVIVGNRKPDAHPTHHVTCLCDCGREYTLIAASLRVGTQSCGCLTIEASQARAKHGHGKDGNRSRTYQSWAAMLKRCRNPEDPGFSNYGARGIAVCDRWAEFENFLADMGERPSRTSIERLDVNGNYEISNCSWATDLQQGRNRRNNRRFRYLDRDVCLSELAEISGIKAHVLRNRLVKSGWSVERAMMTPVAPHRML